MLGVTGLEMKAKQQKNVVALLLLFGVGREDTGGSKEQQITGNNSHSPGSRGEEKQRVNGFNSWLGK